MLMTFQGMKYLIYHLNFLYDMMDVICMIVYGKSKIYTVKTVVSFVLVSYTMDISILTRKFHKGTVLKK